MNAIFDISNEDKAKRLSARILNLVNSEFQRRLSLHVQIFNLFWKSDVSTQEICDAMGKDCPLFIRLAELNINQLNEVATLLGKDLKDFINEQDFVPVYQLKINEDNTVTVQEKL